MSDDLSSTISTAAGGPAQASGDEGSVRQQPLGDLIEADRYLAGKSALADRTRKTFGVRMGKLIPPGSV